MESFSWLLDVSAAAAANLVVHVCWQRVFPAGGMFRAMLAGLLIGAATLVVATLIDPRSTLWGALANAAIYLSFSYVYFHWNNMGETARRIRLVMELQRAPQGLTRAEIVTRYSHREIIDRRLRRLLESRQIIETDSHYHLGNPSVLGMARIIDVAKAILGVR